MLELIKMLVAGPLFLRGYRTYILAVSAMLAALGGWGLEVLIPWIDGNIGLADLIHQSQKWAYEGSLAGAIAYFRAAMPPVQGESK